MREALPIEPDSARQAVVAQPRAVMVPAQAGRIANPLLDAMVLPERAALRGETALRSAMASRPAGMGQHPVETAERLRDATAQPSATGGRLAKVPRVGMVRLRSATGGFRAPELRGMAPRVAMVYPRVTVLRAVVAPRRAVRRVAIVPPPVTGLRAVTVVPHSAVVRRLGAARPSGPGGHRRVTIVAPRATRIPAPATMIQSSRRRSKRSSSTRSLGASSVPSARTMPIGWPATSSWRVD